MHGEEVAGYRLRGTSSDASDIKMCPLPDRHVTPAANVPLQLRIRGAFGRGLLA